MFLGALEGLHGGMAPEVTAGVLGSQQKGDKVEGLVLKSNGLGDLHQSSL